MSEPAQLAEATARGRSTRTPNARSSSSSTCGHRVEQRRPRRRTGCGGPRPRPSGGRGAPRRSATTAVSDLAQLGEQRAPARAADARVVEPVEQRARRRSWWSSTERRVASVGCAVSTSSTCSARTAAAEVGAVARAAARRPPAATRAGARRSRRTGAGGGRARAPRRCWRAAAAASRRGCIGSTSLVGQRRDAARRARGRPRGSPVAQLGGGLVQPAHRRRRSAAPHCSTSTSWSTAESSSESRASASAAGASKAIAWGGPRGVRHGPRAVPMDRLSSGPGPGPRINSVRRAVPRPGRPRPPRRRRPGCGRSRARAGRAVSASRPAPESSTVRRPPRRARGRGGAAAARRADRGGRGRGGRPAAAPSIRPSGIAAPSAATSRSRRSA